MSSVWVAAGTGVVFGLGIIAVWVGYSRPARSLADIVGSIEHGTAVGVERGPGFWRNEVSRIRTRWGAALELCEQTPQQFIAGRLLLAVELAVIPFVVWLGGETGVLPRVMGVELAILAIIVGGVGGWMLGAASLRNEARRRKTEWSAGLAALIELIGMLVAGGSGLETATEEAASAGRGQVFRHVKAALTAATARREPPWPSLRRLGERLEIDDLIEFSESMALASEGARVADALMARAEAAGERELSRELAKAESTSESMVIPVTLMLAGVFVLIGFPIIVSMSQL